MHTEFPKSISPTGKTNTKSKCLTKLAMLSVRVTDKCNIPTVVYLHVGHEKKIFGKNYVVRTTYYLVRTTYYLVRTTHYLMRTTYYLVRTTYYLVRMTYYLVRTT